MSETRIDRRQDGLAHMSGNKSSVKQALETGHVHSHSGFLAHLFGLDGPRQADSLSQHPQHLQQAAGRVAPKSVSKMSALQALKHLNPMEGFVLTINKLMLSLLIFFGVWLFVVYFIRHHEILSTQPLGNEAPRPTASSTDLEIINASRTAIPVRTSSSLGEIYVPEAVSPVKTTTTTTSVMNGAASAQGTNNDLDSATVTKEVPEQAIQTPNVPLNAYSLPVATPEGVRMKTVVNR